MAERAESYSQLDSLTGLHWNPSFLPQPLTTEYSLGPMRLSPWSYVCHCCHLAPPLLPLTTPHFSSSSLCKFLDCHLPTTQLHRFSRHPESAFRPSFVSRSSLVSCDQVHVPPTFDSSGLTNPFAHEELQLRAARKSGFAMLKNEQTLCTSTQLLYSQINCHPLLTGHDFKLTHSTYGDSMELCQNIDCYSSQASDNILEDETDSHIADEPQDVPLDLSSKRHINLDNKVCDSTFTTDTSINYYSSGRSVGSVLPPVLKYKANVYNDSLASPLMDHKVSNFFSHHRLPSERSYSHEGDVFMRVFGENVSSLRGHCSGFVPAGGTGNAAQHLPIHLQPTMNSYLMTTPLSNQMPVGRDYLAQHDISQHQQSQGLYSSRHSEKTHHVFADLSTNERIYRDSRTSFFDKHLASGKNRLAHELNDQSGFDLSRGRCVKSPATSTARNPISHRHQHLYPLADENRSELVETDNHRYDGSLVGCNMGNYNVNLTSDLQLMKDHDFTRYNSGALVTNSASKASNSNCIVPSSMVNLTADRTEPENETNSRLAKRLKASQCFVTPINPTADSEPQQRFQQKDQQKTKPYQEIRDTSHETDAMCYSLRRSANDYPKKNQCPSSSSLGSSKALTTRATITSIARCVLPADSSCSSSAVRGDSEQSRDNVQPVTGQQHINSRGEAEVTSARGSGPHDNWLIADISWSKRPGDDTNQHGVERGADTAAASGAAAASGGGGGGQVCVRGWGDNKVTGNSDTSYGQNSLSTGSLTLLATTALVLEENEKQKAVVNKEETQVSDLYETDGFVPGQNCRESRSSVYNETTGPDCGNQSKFPYRPHRCTVCGRSFKEKSNYNRHMRTHSPLRPYKCNLCSKSFKVSSTLYVHRMSHDTHGRFVCDLCQKDFKRPEHLRQHRRTHTGERPYKCQVCGCCFTTDNTLRTHMRRHTGEKPYQCPVCSKRFTQSSAMKTHLRRHSEQRDFACHLCPMRFKQKYDLTRHGLAHSNLRPFRCTSCPLSFKSASNLKKHCARHDSGCRRGVQWCELGGNDSASLVKSHSCGDCENSKQHKEQAVVVTSNDTNDNICLISRLSNKMKQTGDDDRKFNCSYCTKNYTRKYNLNFHIKQKHEKYSGQC